METEDDRFQIIKKTTLIYFWDRYIQREVVKLFFSYINNLECICFTTQITFIYTLYSYGQYIQANQMFYTETLFYLLLSQS
jgi:hypothetical protein